MIPHSYPITSANLYIIGNGFDRYHKLETRYQAFAFYLQDHQEKIHDYLHKYYGLPYLDRDEKDSWRDPLWSKFEEALADLDIDEVLDDFSNYQANPSADDFRDRDWHAYQIEMEDVVRELTIKLWQAFRGFILDVNFPGVSADLALSFRPHSVFLNFNYTDTLERYYGINRRNILYIHGKALILEEDVILGHGIDPEHFKDPIRTPPKGLTKEQLAEWRENLADEYEYSYDEARKEIKSYFVMSHKATTEIVAKNKDFFEHLHSIDNIYILGHSLAAVDLPYFREIAGSVDLDAVTWSVTFYGEEEMATHLETLKALGIPEKRIKLIRVSDLHIPQLTLFDE